MKAPVTLTHPGTVPSVRNVPGFGSDVRMFDARISLPEQLWSIARKYRLTIIAVLAGALLIGVILTLLMTPKYTSVARIEVSPQQDRVTNVQALRNDDQRESLEFYQTQYELLAARTLAIRVARALQLADDEKFFQRFRVNVKKNPVQYGPPGSDRRLDLAATILLHNLTITPIRRSSLVDIEFTSPDPAFSTQVANTWAQQFAEATIARRYDATAGARAFLAARLTEYRQKLEDSERKLIAYSADKQIITLSETRDKDGRTTGERSLVSADLEALNQELATATSARIQAQSEVGSFNRSTADGGNDTIAALRKSRADAFAERARLLTQFESGYPAVAALTSKIQAIDSSITGEERHNAGSSRARYNEALARETELRTQVAALEQRYLGQKRDIIQYNIYQREVDTNRQLYDALLQRYKEIGVAGVGTSNINVIDPAQLPRFPSSPRVALNLLIALIFGVFVTAGYILLREQVDDGIKEAGELSSVFGLASLGSIPKTGNEVPIEQAIERKSILNEAYASAATSLSFLTDHGAPRSLMLTSAQPSEGKSTSAYALAHSFAVTGRRVLLVDADLRNPSLEKLIGRPPSAQGLSNYLAGMNDVHALIINGGRQNLDLLPAGLLPPNPAELLAGARWRNLIETLSTEYDNIIVDSPPVLGLADVPLIASGVEGVVMVVRMNGARIRSIRAALGRIAISGTPVLGALATMLDRRHDAYGYGYGYGYGATGDG